MSQTDFTAKLADTIALLKRVQAEFSPATLASSLGAEDMVLTDLVAKHAPGITIFSLDTGRLNPETYDLMAKVQEAYGDKVKLEVYYPQAEPIQLFVEKNGINGFYKSVELRKNCCAIRKVEPLKRALKDKEAWITGMRRAQSADRANLALEEFDADHLMAKFNPLAAWSEKEVWEYLRNNNVPYNELHDKFYPSIGCAPCTRSVAMGEDVRAGRWWWEDASLKECGLHVKKT